jgi:hypothetical protein
LRRLTKKREEKRRKELLETKTTPALPLIRVVLLRRPLLVERDKAVFDLLLMLLIEEREEDRVEKLAAFVPVDATLFIRPALLTGKEIGGVER